MTKFVCVVIGCLSLAILFPSILFISLPNEFDFEDTVIESIKHILFRNRKNDCMICLHVFSKIKNFSSLERTKKNFKTKTSFSLFF